MTTEAYTKTIYKYLLANSPGPQTIRLPKNARVLHVGSQDEILMLWCMVDPNNASVTRRFEVFATGQKVDSVGLNYLGTTQVQPFVWHIFEHITNESVGWIDGS